jgi:hypothetical protein
VNHDLEIRFYFGLGIILSFAIMKWVSANAGKTRFRPSTAFWLSPLCSIVSWNDSPMIDSLQLKRVVSQAALGAAALVVTYYLYFKIVTSFELRGITLSYLAVVPALIVGVAGLSPVRLLFVLSGRVIPPVHRHLLQSRSVAEFWGNYNVWVSDWFLQVIFKPLRRRPMLASFLVFTFSGIWHELLINVPLLIVTRVNLIGTMFIYFLLQWLATIVDRALLRNAPLVRRTVILLAVVGPAPLFFNEGLLRIFGWWH